MSKMKTLTLEQAQKLAALAAAANSVGTSAAAFASAREAMSAGVNDDEAHRKYILGGCQKSLTTHFTLLCLLAVEAEKLRDTKEEEGVSEATR
jgi:hypothetical protein